MTLPINEIICGDVRTVLQSWPAVLAQGILF